MNPIRQLPLRKIAESELSKHLGDLDVAVRDELATSLVRQWLTTVAGHGVQATQAVLCLE
jgi:hypothetical protein